MTDEDSKIYPPNRLGGISATDYLNRLDYEELITSFTKQGDSK